MYFFTKCCCHLQPCSLICIKVKRKSIDFPINCQHHTQTLPFIELDSGLGKINVTLDSQQCSSFATIVITITIKR